MKRLVILCLAMFVLTIPSITRAESSVAYRQDIRQDKYRLENQNRDKLEQEKQQREKRERDRQQRDRVEHTDMIAGGR
ncbi:MAG: hypothetical protein K0Q77_1218 [Anaerosporomusa subterranea]|nr:hypothetical protein [Anaerosporomusa subterranea]